MSLTGRGFFNCPGKGNVNCSAYVNRIYVCGGVLLWKR